jgi:hypothetical protein
MVLANFDFDFFWSWDYYSWTTKVSVILTKVFVLEDMEYSAFVLNLTW